ncbi:hypothetical protein [Streptomyces sp. CB00455]|nr:hypothetical protein [Streptomyces sp. CB00455]
MSLHGEAVALAGPTGRAAAQDGRSAGHALGVALLQQAAQHR